MGTNVKIGAQRAIGGKTIEEVGDRLDGDVLGDAPLDAYDRSAAIAAAVFRAPGAMDAPCAVSYGPVPGSVYCGHRFLDVLVHGWDVAVSTGQSVSVFTQSRAGNANLNASGSVENLPRACAMLMYS